ncbi:palmdelphin [Osmerus mordax]|uniref:palmdelphin n=1 Tax=Osmerus mordax TaxID=8014 RepID=UPI00350FA90E
MVFWFWVRDWIQGERRVQEDIALKKQEIDKDKLKLQHLKKRFLRDQWLMEGSSALSSQQKQSLRDDQTHTRLLQGSIHRMEKEVEELEREESMISTNESFILKRLKAVEKTSEDIIKEAKKNFKQELLQFPPEAPLSYRPLNYRLSDTHTDRDQPKQTLFAMEINVQKDRRTGESRVISTATVTPQELQQRGVKVYDDGRKCVYAMRCDGPGAGPGAGPGSHGVDELSSSEVEQLLRDATERKHQRAPQRSDTSCSHQGELSTSSRALPLPAVPSTNHRGSRGQSLSQSNRRVNGHQLSHDHNQEVLSGTESCYLEANHIPARSYLSSEDKYYQPVDSYRQQQGHTPSYSDLYRLPADSQPSAIFYNSAYPDRCPSPLYEDDAPFRILNALPVNPDVSEPVTAIFMGFQTAEDDSGRGLGYEGSIKAELVVIGDDDDDGGDSHVGRGRNYGYQQGQRGVEPEAANCNGGGVRGRRPWKGVCKQEGRSERRLREGKTNADTQMLN